MLLCECVERVVFCCFCYTFRKRVKRELSHPCKSPAKEKLIAGDEDEIKSYGTKGPQLEEDGPGDRRRMSSSQNWKNVRAVMAYYCSLRKIKRFDRQRVWLYGAICSVFFYYYYHILTTILSCYYYIITYHCSMFYFFRCRARYAVSLLYTKKNDFHIIILSQIDLTNGCSLVWIYFSVLSILTHTGDVIFSRVF